MLYKNDCLKIVIEVAAITDTSNHWLWLTFADFSTNINKRRQAEYIYNPYTEAQVYASIQYVRLSMELPIHIWHYKSATLQ